MPPGRLDPVQGRGAPSALSRNFRAPQYAPARSAGSGSKRAANVRKRLRSTMRNRFGENPESRKNRAITRTSSSIVATPKAACHAGGRGFESFCPRDRITARDSALRMRSRDRPFLSVLATRLRPHIRVTAPQGQRGSGCDSHPTQPACVARRPGQLRRAFQGERAPRRPAFRGRRGAPWWATGRTPPASGRSRTPLSDYC
jgi:hypothetical protein